MIFLLIGFVLLLNIIFLLFWVMDEWGGRVYFPRLCPFFSLDGAMSFTTMRTSIKNFRNARFFLGYRSCVDFITQFYKVWIYFRLRFFAWLIIWYATGIRKLLVRRWLIDGILGIKVLDFRFLLSKTWPFGSRCFQQLICNEDSILWMRFC